MSQGLAPIVTARLLDAIRDAANLGIGVLLVEQHVYRALAVADRFYVMSRGRIVMEGAAEEYRGREHELQDSYLASL
jgi:branched-chain amino acid transport system ATP-binding protein